MQSEVKIQRCLVSLKNSNIAKWVELKLVHIVGYTSVTRLLTEHSLSKTNVELCVL
jgi:hypothetical protein